MQVLRLQFQQRVPLYVSSPSSQREKTRSSKTKASSESREVRPAMALGKLKEAFHALNADLNQHVTDSLVLFAGQVDTVGL